MHWRHSRSPVRTKFKQTLSVRKVMCTVFWDRKGILLIDFLPRGETMNADHYCETLRKLRRAIQNKRRGMLTAGVVLLHDNGRPHTAWRTAAVLTEFGWELFDHPPYSPDLAPSDFHVFLHLKKFLSSSERFGNDEELMTSVTRWFHSQAAEFYDRGIQKLISRYDKCPSSDGGYSALFTAKHMLALWKTLYEDQTNIELPDQSEKRSDTRSVFQLYTSEMSDKDSSSLHAHSLAASRVEQALSEVASSLSSFTPRPGPQRAWLLQLQIWLLLAEIYLSLEQVSAATACIQEATSIFPLSHHIMYMRGLVHEYKQEFTEAKLCFQNAVAINPTHIKSLQHLGLIYHYLGSQRLAEKTLRDAARIDPASHQTWYNLGKVLESLGEFDTASDCMATALEVEISNPILPFSSIPLTFD
ncbi:hypothetical protein ANN_24159 [Periplaneta americana]|uniref:Uncharacterized protein n=1 Tax=Periplaneta americana TaxID=6978 RepID=A0ABQ8S313_PERAM|nr:hypothetical protein ANN_24159 [Periplaneta americana]